MKKTWSIKRVVSLLLLVVLLAGVAGCGKGKTKTEDEGGVITINWMPQNDGPSDADSPVTKAIEERFGIKLNYIYMDRNNEVELLNIRIASGEVPDVMRRNDSIYRNFISQGIISEVPEDMIKQYAPTVYDLTVQNGGADLWNIAKQDGKMYGLPILNKDGKYHQVSIWRDDWLKKVGINKIPETLDEAEQAFYKFRNEDPDGNGKKDTYALSLNGIKGVLDAYGPTPFDMFWSLKDGEVVLNATRPEMKDALTRLHKWYADGLIDPEFITGENKGQHFAHSVVFWNGRIGYSVPGMPYHVYPSFRDGEYPGSANYTNFKELQGENATFDYGYPLVGPDGTSRALSWGVFAGDYFMMGRNVKTGSEKMKKILEICEALNTDHDFYMLTGYGREGIDYEMNGKAVVSKIDRKQGHSLGLATNGIQYLVNNFEFVENDPDSEEVAFSKKYGQTGKAYTNVVWGGLPSDTTYKEIIKQKVEENYFAFIIGNRDIGEFDAFVQELNAAGLEQLTKEAREWYKARYE